MKSATSEVETSSHYFFEMLIYGPEQIGISQGISG
jgi:hypothetical protein